ncbi:hypothetical protein DFP72DRAFT_57226 [Ephemerocybe angulata]|uniref:BTB domain-containing protein n=1 Tax=Ephemerocybe angulata TaxID=980116 RepID=A0A8H6IAJ1_9AGAR|nr:hypothetical protein DFP72DRAFT_57226 [Tulosesus angulatus]
MAEQITPPGSQSAPHRVEEYYWRTVVFKVGDGLFRVPRGQFIAQSEVFSGMFGVPPLAENLNGSIEGESDDHPIVLEGYKEKDFKALLKVLYPSMASLTEDDNYLSREDLKSALKLSTKWEMKQVRQFAIRQLSARSGPYFLTPVEKISLARAHWVSTWLIEGLVDLVNDNPKLSPDELDSSVGLRTAFRIARLKLERILSPAGPRCYHCGRNTRSEPISGELVRETFKDEIDEMVEAERQY